MERYATNVMINGKGEWHPQSRKVLTTLLRAAAKAAGQKATYYLYLGHILPSCEQGWIHSRGTVDADARLAHCNRAVEAARDSAHLAIISTSDASERDLLAALEAFLARNEAWVVDNGKE